MYKAAFVYVNENVCLCTYVHTYRRSYTCVNSNTVGVNAILSISETSQLSDSVTLLCEMPCFSSDLQCVIFNLTANNMNIDVSITTGPVTGSVMSYSYPTQAITLNCLNSSTTYNYCVIATNITNMVEVGIPLCGNFTTEKTAVTKNGNNDSGTYVCKCIGMYVSR